MEDREAFLIRSRELRAAQRLGLLPPPGEIPKRLLGEALGLSETTVRRIETVALLKIRNSLETEGLSYRKLLAILMSKPTPNQPNQ